ncbi:hypothetical protein D3C84_425470 [compost metagenome]
MQTRRFCHCRGRGRNIYSHPLLSKFVEVNFKTKPCNAIETKKLCRSWICRAFYRVGRGRERSGYNTLNFNRLARTLLCKPLIFKGLPPWRARVVVTERGSCPLPVKPEKWWRVHQSGWLTPEIHPETRPSSTCGLHLFQSAVMALLCDAGGVRYSSRKQRKIRIRITP